MRAKPQGFHPQGPPGPPPAQGVPIPPPQGPPGQPPPQGVPIPQLNMWTTGLCGCFEDPANCCITWCCPCITAGQIAEILDRGDTSSGMGGYSYIYRGKLRNQYMLPDSPCCDWCVHYCCPLCAICQEYRELQNRGFDMRLGWHGNMQRMGGGVQMNVPPLQGGMTR